jgi:hypothetical protein
MTEPAALAPRRFAVSLRNAGAEDLVLRKIYTVMTDPAAESKGFLRVIDESGEDYLYPTDYFAELQLTPDLGEQLLTTA